MQPAGAYRGLGRFFLRTSSSGGGSAIPQLVTPSSLSKGIASVARDVQVYNVGDLADVTGQGLVTAETLRYHDANGRRSRASIASGMDVKGRAKGFASVPGCAGCIWET